MKPGSLVKCHYLDKIGVVLRKYSYDDPTWPSHWDRRGLPTRDKFDVMWRDGTIGHNIWNYDLEIINE